MSIHNHENYWKNLSLKILLFYMIFREIPRFNSRDSLFMIAYNRQLNVYFYSFYSIASLMYNAPKYSRFYTLQTLGVDVPTACKSDCQALNCLYVLFSKAGLWQPGMNSNCPFS